MKKSLAVVVCLLTALPMLAAEGAIPIWQPTAITDPGHYVLTRDISHSDTLVYIVADDVVLDLNGFTLDGTPGARVVIDIPPPDGA